LISVGESAGTVSTWSNRATGFIAIATVGKTPPPAATVAMGVTGTISTGASGVQLVSGVFSGDGSNIKSGAFGVVVGVSGYGAARVVGQGAKSTVSLAAAGIQELGSRLFG
jgi:hypothetical protein